jgi:hypothetical protein
MTLGNTCWDARKMLTIKSVSYKNTAEVGTLIDHRVVPAAAPFFHTTSQGSCPSGLIAPADVLRNLQKQLKSE